MPAPPGPYRTIYAAVSRIPRGRVATYGQVAALAGLPGRARQVGTALGSLPDGSAVPWHRVVNAKGEISARGDLGLDGLHEGFQRHLLEEEGVRFDRRGRIDLDRYRWEPMAVRLGRPRKRRVP